MLTYKMKKKFLNKLIFNKVMRKLKDTDFCYTLYKELKKNNFMYACNNIKLERG